MEGILMAFGMNFLGELGDKTQMVTLTFATRFKARIVLAAIAAATTAINAVSVVLGSLAGNLIPTHWVKLLAGLAFVGFGLTSLRSDEGEEGATNGRKMSPFWLVASTFFLAEFGDKTMLSNVALAANFPAWQVFVGSTLGMVASDGLAIWVGKTLGARLPEKSIRLAAAFAFFGFGAWSLVQGLRVVGPAVWASVAAVVAGMGFVTFRPWGNKSAGSDCTRKSVRPQ